MPQRARQIRDGVSCTLQDEDAREDLSRSEAQEVTRDGKPGLEIVSYTVHLDPDNEDEEDLDITDAICLSRAGWGALVQMYAYRYPEAAARILARAQGWQEKREA